MGLVADTPERLYGATDGQAVTPSDTQDLAIGFSRGIILGTAGSLRVTLTSGTVLTYPNLVAGVTHAICATRIHQTGTSAQYIVAIK